MKTFLKVILIAALWILIVGTGRMGTIDTVLRLKMANSWWNGEPEIKPNYQPSHQQDIQAGIQNLNGERRYAYDSGQPLLMLPSDWLSTQIKPYFPKIGRRDFQELGVSFFTFFPINVATVVACFWLLTLFGFEKNLAGLSSIIWLITTTVWHYSQVPFHNNQVLLFVTLSYGSVLAFLKTKKTSFLVASGLAMGSVFLIRTTSIFHIFFIFTYFLGCTFHEEQLKKVRQLLKNLALIVIGILPFYALGRIIDYWRFGGWWPTTLSAAKYLKSIDPLFANSPQQSILFNNTPDVGIVGVLFSPAKSIFIYDPLLLPCIILAILVWKKFSPYLQWYIVTVTFDLLTHIMFTSSLIFWHGDGAWAARYHVTSIHLLLIPLTCVFLKQLFSFKGFKAWLMTGIISIAIIVQIASVSMLFSLEYNIANLSRPIDKTYGHFRLGYDPIYNEFRLGQRFFNLACYINPQLSEQCLSQLAKKVSPEQERTIKYENQTPIFAFNYTRYGLNRKWTLLTWGFMLILAIIGTTCWFVNPIHFLGFFK